MRSERSVNLVDSRQCSEVLVLARSNERDTGSASQTGVDESTVWSLEKMESSQGMSAIRQRVHNPRPLTLGPCMPHQGEVDVESLPPVWWFQYFDPCWTPLRKWLSRKKTLTLTEFQLIANHASGLTSIEKTIAVSAFVVYKNLQC